MIIQCIETKSQSCSTNDLPTRAILETADDSGDLIFASVLAVDVAVHGGTERVLRVSNMPLRAPGTAHFSGTILFTSSYANEISQNFVSVPQRPPDMQRMPASDQRLSDLSRLSRQQQASPNPSDISLLFLT